MEHPRAAQVALAFRAHANRQVACARSAVLYFAGGGHAESLLRRLVSLHFGHIFTHSVSIMATRRAQNRDGVAKKLFLDGIQQITGAFSNRQAQIDVDHHFEGDMQGTLRTVCRERGTPPAKTSACQCGSAAAQAD